MNVWYVGPILNEIILGAESHLDYDYNGTYFWPSFDVFNSSEADSKQELFIIDGTLYNMNDAGQFLWGVTAAKLGVEEFVARSGAHINNALTDRNGGNTLLDSPADQKAISKGYELGKSFNAGKYSPKPNKPSYINMKLVENRRNRKQTNE